MLAVLNPPPHAHVGADLISKVGLRHLDRSQGVIHLKLHVLVSEPTASVSDLT